MRHIKVVKGIASSQESYEFTCRILRQKYEGSSFISCGADDCTENIGEDEGATLIEIALVHEEDIFTACSLLVKVDLIVSLELKSNALEHSFNIDAIFQCISGNPFRHCRNYFSKLLIKKLGVRRREGRWGRWVNGGRVGVVGHETLRSNGGEEHREKNKKKRLL